MSNRNKLLLAILSTLLITSAIAIYQWLLVDLPDPNQLYQHTTAPSTKIYDRNNVLLYEISDPHQGMHTPLKLTEIPRWCSQATIATEDATFYQNPGVDLWAILRALYINYEGGEVLSGGSTITQQLARNLLLSPQERSQINLTRKLREAMLAWRIARNYSKDEILTLYLNEAYYGNLAYGIEAASRSYFGKHAAELDLAECAMLAGLPQSPANYNPLENLAKAQARQSVVLDLMLKNNFITAEDAESARHEQLGFAPIAFPIKAPHFVMYIRGQLERTFGLEAIYKQGLEVHTTLDLNMQNTAQRVVQYRLADLTKPREGEPPRNVHNAAVIILDPYTGEILTMLGSPDYFDATIDGAVNATTAYRQPGSSIKPLNYAAAFDPATAAKYGYQPLTPATMMVDVRTAFVTAEGAPYVPENYDRTWRGPVLLRPSLASSYNLVAVKVLDYIKLDTLVDVARNLGITTFDNKHFGLSLTLGGGEVKLIELTTTYAAFANGGRKIEPIAITRITDHDGNLIYQSDQTINPGQQVLDERTAYLITDILSDNDARRSTFGAGSPLHLTRPAAAKTGTTQDWRDNWTVGYTPDLVTGVWVGNANNEPMQHVSGVTGAAPMWHDIMEELHKGRPVKQFKRPDGLVEVTVCSENGLLPLSSEQATRNKTDAVKRDKLNLNQFTVPCPHTINELFISGTEPRRSDNWHQQIAIDHRNGLRAGLGCPLEFVTFGSYTRHPTEAEAWAKKQNLPMPPLTFSPLCGGNSDSPALASEPQPATEPLIFNSPDQGSVFRVVPNIPADKQKIEISVRPANGVNVQNIALFINGQPLATEAKTLWQLTPGEYRFAAVGQDSHGREIRSKEVTIRVVNGE